MLNFVKFEELYTVINNNYYYPVIKCTLFEPQKTFMTTGGKEDILSMDSENKNIKDIKQSDKCENPHEMDHISDTVDIWFMFSEEESLLQFYEDPFGKNEIDLHGFSFMDDSVSNHLKSKLDLFYFFEERKRLAFEEYISDEYFTNLCMKEEGLLYDFFRAVWVAYSYNNGKSNQVTEEDFRWYTRLPVLNIQKYMRKSLTPNYVSEKLKTWDEV